MSGRTVRIFQAQDSPIPCGRHDRRNGAKEVECDSPVGRLATVLCDECFAEAIATGTFMGEPILATREFIDVRYPAERKRFPPIVEERLPEVPVTNVDR
jgi:hypothetical protein